MIILSIYSDFHGKKTLENKIKKELGIRTKKKVDITVHFVSLKKEGYCYKLNADFKIEYNEGYEEFTYCFNRAFDASVKDYLNQLNEDGDYEKEDKYLHELLHECVTIYKENLKETILDVLNDME